MYMIYININTYINICMCVYIMMFNLSPLSYLLSKIIVLVLHSLWMGPVWI